MYTLSKSYQILKQANRVYQSQRKRCSSELIEDLEARLQALDDAVIARDRETASQVAQSLETFLHQKFPPNRAKRVLGTACAVVLALAVALFVRQLLFEHMHIPTGSMRPSFKEGDFLLVSKTRHGINLPLQPGHMTFDRELVQRLEPIIFTSDGLDVLHGDQRYFGVIPSRLHLIKRVIGKPGDTLYFYGGQVWGMDAEGKEIHSFRNTPGTAHLEHIPFRNFEGQVRSLLAAETGHSCGITCQHMGFPVARIAPDPLGKIHYSTFCQQQWLPQSEQALAELWGIGNYAMARLLTQEQLLKLKPALEGQLERGILYLELRHSPRLLPQKLPITPPVMEWQSSYLPLQREHLERLMSGMTSSRFWVKNGFVYRTKDGVGQPVRQSFTMPHVPDGAYEFDRGKVLGIGWGNHCRRLPRAHPLYSREAKHIQTLFNQGIELSREYHPDHLPHPRYPKRYAYFRNGDLYVLGKSIFSKDDPALEEFLIWEEWLEETVPHYRGFVDRGPPLKGGKLDKQFLSRHGLRVPEGQYLLLGDNHASSRDSRVFGFVPEENLRGVPTAILWPWNGRKATSSPEQPPLVTLSWLGTWGTLTLAGGLCYTCSRYRRRKPVFKKRS